MKIEDGGFLLVKTEEELGLLGVDLSLNGSPTPRRSEMGRENTITLISNNGQ